MKPGAAKATSEWLSKADQQGIGILSCEGIATGLIEREVAVRLFSSLGSRSGPRQRSLSEPNRPISRRKSLPLPPREYACTHTHITHTN